MSLDNSTDVATANCGLLDQMMIYDRLPPPFREFLSDADFDFDARDVWTFWWNCQGAFSLKEMLATLQQRAEAYVERMHAETYGALAG